MRYLWGMFFVVVLCVGGSISGWRHRTAISADRRIQTVTFTSAQAAVENRAIYLQALKATFPARLEMSLQKIALAEKAAADTADADTRLLLAARADSVTVGLLLKRSK